MYTLELRLGTWECDSYVETILASKDKEILHQKRNELEKCIQNGFNATKKFFENLSINMPYDDEYYFDEMYNGELFRMSIYEIKEV